MSKMPKQFIILPNSDGTKFNIAQLMEWATNLFDHNDPSVKNLEIEYYADHYQAYLYPDANPVRVDIKKELNRSERPRYFITIEGDDRDSDVVEFRISDEEYTDLLKLVGKEPIHKQIYTVDINDTYIEIVVVDSGSDAGFAYAEVESTSKEDAAAFVWPLPTVNVEEAPESALSMPEYWKKYRLGA